MALYWPEARVVVRSEGLPDEEGYRPWPSDALVLTMRIDQADDKNFVESVRRLVRERTALREREMLEYVLLGGTPLPSVLEMPGEEGHERDVAAEERLRAALVDVEWYDEEGEKDREDESGEERREDDEQFWDDAWGTDPLGVGDLETPRVQLVIHHCEEVFVRG